MTEPRTTDGLVCPHCRTRHGAAPASRLIARCANDGYALVTAESFDAADGDPFLGTTVGERFVVLARLGAGSMGTVYRARQQPMGRDVALKILRADRAFDANAKARFTREARAMSLLTSPYTVTVFDFGEIPDTRDELADGASLYLAMEMLEGEALGERLKRLTRLSVPEAVRIARQALLSLAEAHDKGIVHRDLKPDNLFLTRSVGEAEEICKVLDFGIAKIKTEHNLDALETQAGTVFGTPRYMSPEQAQGRSLDARSDIYSLGVLLYHMLVGRPPFTDDDAVVVMARHIKTQPTAPAVAAPEANIGEALSNVVMRALAKDPADRPASAQHLLDEIDRIAALRARAAADGRPADATGGEVPVLVRDDLEAAPAMGAASPSARKPRVWRAAAFALGSALLLTLVVLGSLQRARRPEPLRSIGATIERRNEAARAASAAVSTSAEPAASLAAPPPQSSAAMTLSSPRAPAATHAPSAHRSPVLPGRGYTRFE
jgi:eukaryotic-like serine/threonine-protein kinase